MSKYEVVLIDANGVLVTSKIVEANSFKEALGLVVSDPDDYEPVFLPSRRGSTPPCKNVRQPLVNTDLLSSHPKVQSYGSTKYNAKVTLIT